MRKGKGSIFLVIVLSLAFFLISAEAQQKRKAPKAQPKKSGTQGGAGFGITSSRAPIDIESDSAEMDTKRNIGVFKGNVVAKQEDITLYCNALMVHTDQETKKIREIVASGNVRIVQFERRATAQKATFYQDDNKIVLEGDAVVREGDNVIRGERVVHYLDEDKSVVEGAKGSRVSTTITPSQKEPGEGQKTKGESKKEQ
jgi:lipopolysaccharide export system protein LptA